MFAVAAAVDREAWAAHNTGSIGNNSSLLLLF
jgi:hypothetical protein